MIYRIIRLRTSYKIIRTQSIGQFRGFSPFPLPPADALCQSERKAFKASGKPFTSADAENGLPYRDFDTMRLKQLAR